MDGRSRYGKRYRDVGWLWYCLADNRYVHPLVGCCMLGLYISIGLVAVYVLCMHFYYKGKSDGRDELAIWVKNDLFKGGRNG